MGTFTKDWDETQPTNKTIMNLADDYNRDLRVAVAERLSGMFNGLIAGETTLDSSAKMLKFYEQSEIDTPAAGYGNLALEDTGLKYKDADPSEVILIDPQGRISVTGGTTLTLAMIKEVLLNDSFLQGLGVDGDAVNIIGADSNDVAVLGATAETATSDPPVEQAGLANKLTVDDEMDDLATDRADAYNADTCLGEWTDEDSEGNPLAVNSVYRATGSGFFVGWSSSNPATLAQAYCKCDDAYPPVHIFWHHTGWLSGQGTGTSGFTVPVRKDYYVTTTLTGGGLNLLWIPVKDSELVKQ